MEDTNQPITRQDLNEALDRAVEAIAAAVRADMKATEERIEDRAQETARATYARIEQVETALLTEFHKWASPLEMRVKSHAAALRAFDAEQEFLADRVTKLEGKPPDA